MTQSGQLSIDRDDSALAGLVVDDRIGERAARSSLRAQIARLERELSQIVAGRFPYISPVAGSPSATSQSSQRATVPGGSGSYATGAATGPRVLGLEQLEQSRDYLAGRLQDLRARAAQRDEHENEARELLERMKLEPGRYKFVRLPVSDLGQGGCGVWEVRPRLGLIGMLAGWWQVKLSSGCPLERGSRATRDPAPQT